MKKTLITNVTDIPCEIFKSFRDTKIYDSSCSPEAKVYFIDKYSGYYLKSADAGSLKNEAVMTEYFHKKGLGAEIITYTQYGERDWLLTSAVRGEDCTYFEYLSKPERLCDIIAERLRELHDLNFDGCPIKNRNESYFALAESNFQNGVYDPSYIDESLKGISAKEAYSLLSEVKNEFKCEVLLHGDYCLPNIMLDNWNFSGFIDLGNAGIGDRHIDLFWGAWTLNFNLGTDKYKERFFDVYGRDKIDSELIKSVSIAEAFG